ncbi:MAG: tryptophan--tRNA ligase [Eubacteriales bacterium]
MEETKKKIILSGIQPSGQITLGNYLGAVKNWVDLQNDGEDNYERRYFVADLHALTVRQVPADLRRRTLETYVILMACGLDPEQTMLFVQSHVPTHSQLAWILNCYTQFGELSRMTQFKDKSQKNPENVNAGLFTYPALMAADILIYNADMVPVGVDQKQHLELARTIANRFNGLYGDTFVVPEGYIPKASAKIYSLADPTRKMSKSDPNVNSYVALMDPRDVILRKFKKAVTDSEAQVRYAEGKDGINNLMTIYSVFTGKNYEEIEREFEGRGYGDFKLAVGEVVADGLAPIQERYQQLMADRPYVEGLMAENAEKAFRITRRVVDKVYRKVGLLGLKR